MPLGKYSNVEFWAEGGIVYIFNTKLAETVNSYSKASDETRSKLLKGLPPKEFLKRAIAVGLIESGRLDGYPADLANVRKFVQTAYDVYKQALEQGGEANLTTPSKRPAQIVVPESFTTKQFKKKTAEEILLDGIEYE